MAYQNFFATRLGTDIGANDNAITLETIPTATSGRLVLEARNPTQREIIKYTGVSGNQITGVTRGHGGTTAKQHLKNALVEMNATGEDLQDLYDAFNSFSSTNGSGWLSLANTPNLVEYLGGGFYDLTFTGVDLTNILSPSTRLRSTRTVAAPTRSTLLNGTNQYWLKSSPSKMTFTDDFVASAWLKISSYPANGAVMVSRFNGTSGWGLVMNDNGTVDLFGRNGGMANVSRVTSTVSVPLNQWVHVAIQLDMSAFSTTPTTSYIMINGVDVSATVTRTGTNPTSLIQAGNLEVGSWNGGLLPFPGMLSQVAVFSTKVTQATMRTYMSQGLTGSEPGLVTAFSFDGNANDLNTTTPNNLTAAGAGAGTLVATNADSPFGTQGNGSISSTLDYGAIEKVTLSGSDTVVRVTTADGNTIPNIGGISALDYSNSKSPHNYPIDRKFMLHQQLRRTGISGAGEYAWADFIRWNIAAMPVGTRFTVNASNWGATASNQSIGIKIQYGGMAQESRHLAAYHNAAELSMTFEKQANINEVIVQCGGNVPNQAPYASIIQEDVL